MVAISVLPAGHYFRRRKRFALCKFGKSFLPHERLSPCRFTISVKPLDLSAGDVCFGVICRHSVSLTGCPLHPPKRTPEARTVMSAKGPSTDTSAETHHCSDGTHHNKSAPDSSEYAHVCHPCFRLQSLGGQARQRVALTSD